MFFLNFFISIASFLHSLMHCIPNANEGALIRNDCTIPAYDINHFGVQKLARQTSLEFRSIVINEVMVDPAPVVQLPEAEYVELFNNSELSLDLKDWKVSDNVTTGTLPEFILPPKTYLILCDRKNEAYFRPFGKVISPEQWPVLNNGGDKIILQSPDNFIVDEIEFDKSWYQDNEKSGGGWSIAQINPGYRCSDKENWRASTATSGGTPGSKNANSNEITDSLGPVLLQAIATDSLQIKLLFSEKLDPASLHVTNFEIVPHVNIKSAFLTLERDAIIIQLEKPLISQQLYQLTAKNLTDCTGNLRTHNEQPIEVVLSDPPTVNDLVINEILFNPKPAGVDFIEIYNLSNKYLNLIGLRVKNKMVEAGQELAINSNHIIHPKSYTVFTEDLLQLIADHPNVDQNLVFESAKMPKLPDEAGNVSLFIKGDVLIDSYDYFEHYHHELIKDFNGVSLEKISPFVGSQNKNNWHSASSMAGYATPGEKNSIWLETVDLHEQIIVEPKLFRPNDNGNYNFTLLKYQFSQPGYSASVAVYTATGVKIKELANHELLGTRGFFLWDGTKEDKSIASTGYYIITISLFDLTGKVKNIKKLVAVVN